MSNTRYAVSVKELKELAQKQSELLWKVRQAIHAAEVGTVARQLEHCLRDAYGRLEVQDLIEEHADLSKRRDVVESLLRKHLGATNWTDLNLLSDPQKLAELIATNGSSLDRFLSEDLADEVRQLAVEKGYKHLERGNLFEDSALSDDNLNAHSILYKLKQCQDVTEVQALLEKQQGDAIMMMRSRQAKPGGTT